MNPDKMTPDELTKFLAQNSYTFVSIIKAAELDRFLAEFCEMQEEAAEYVLEASELKEARAVIARIMSK